MFKRLLALRIAFFVCSVFVGIPLGFYFNVQHSFAQTATSTIQNQIDQTNSQIKQIQDEIAKLQGQLTTTSAQKKTLQNAVAALNLNILKLQKSITLAQAQIKQKDSQITQISSTITTTSSEIGDVQNEVAGSLRSLAAIDKESLVTVFLSGGTLSTFFDQAATLATVRIDLENKIEQLSSLKQTLQVNKSVAEQRRLELASLQQNLSQQKTGLAIAKESQTELLTETKNQESAYQKQIAQKKAQEAQFENDLENFQAQLKLQFNANSLPATGQGALQWPVDRVIITQYFGNTAFATQNSQIYNGHGHSGIDLGASPGTPLKAARAGVVLGTGNTDLTCPGASFGKWVFIKHDNGLSTLYAHMATFAVSKGDTVATGQVIGYSDTTGYATGPHLHFGVYATAGSEIASFPSSSCKGKVFTMPVGDLKAYLNPLSYLPAVPGKQ